MGRSSVTLVTAAVEDFGDICSYEFPKHSEDLIKLGPYLDMGVVVAVVFEGQGSVHNIKDENKFRFDTYEGLIAFLDSKARAPMIENKQPGLLNSIKISVYGQSSSKALGAMDLFGGTTEGEELFRGTIYDLPFYLEATYRSIHTWSEIASNITPCMTESERSAISLDTSEIEFQGLLLGYKGVGLSLSAKAVAHNIEVDASRRIKLEIFTDNMKSHGAVALTDNLDEYVKNVSESDLLKSIVEEVNSLDITFGLIETLTALSAEVKLNCKLSNGSNWTVPLRIVSLRLVERTKSLDFTEAQINKMNEYSGKKRAAR